MRYRYDRGDTHYCDIKPVRCCECGVEPEEQGEWYLRRQGWEGFSRLKDERLGTCPGCKLANALQAAEKEKGDAD